jgi:hypothetical protein
MAAFTKPVVKLPQPGLTRAFYWGVKEDDLVLYPNFMHDGFQGHTPLQELGSMSANIPRVW